MSVILNARTDLIQWMTSMLPDIDQEDGQTGAAYGKPIRAFELFARPLWGIFSLIASGDRSPETDAYIKRIKSGICPKYDQYWPKATTKTRQIVVESAVFGFGLAYCKERLLRYFNDIERKQLQEWLNSVNQCELPRGNWLFFAVLINYGLKVNQMRYSQEAMDRALKSIESMYVGDGWYFDGFAGQRDYYVPFAFHYYGLLYSTLLPEGPEKELYGKRAERFAKDFIYWFDSEGRSVPFGRSLTYRFAHVAFWSAMVVSGRRPFPLSVMKGIIFRNLRWWSEQPIFSATGQLSIGYGYPNLIMSEDYNASGSPAWAFKTFILLLLPEHHPFWTIEEASYPAKMGIRNLKHGGFLAVHDHLSAANYLLSTTQCSRLPILHTSEKYGKFCYSTYYGFNISRDVSGIEHSACDSTLALAVAGSRQFFSRTQILHGWQTSEYGYSEWQEQPYVFIRTWLIPLNSLWHIRIHCVDAKFSLDSYEGGFPQFEWNEKFNQPIADEHSIRLSSHSGTSAVIDAFGNRKPMVVPQDPNSNLYNCEKNAIPVLYKRLTVGKSWIGCFVYGSPKELWNPSDVPVAVMDNGRLEITQNERHIVVDLNKSRQQ
ncbi:DUF2264 domain-containing protein [Sporolactobacillus shoreicorticis]|uniref:DUF2264 domain-containing protein n=1 Tax=Sporolactobacillus shoreicorticis TaxID=1923877 RepID=A0ABW5S145_9BACL|nr:DUF2264 domain-containing protein [Sporolactobacillus shoreicorticis]MCO7124665.1 DUF2264 domain-containing protein [Sporolactobacillus shoreicorticis]